VSFREDLNLVTPRLRRYARGLVAAHPAPNEIADDLVRAALQRVRDMGLVGRWFDLDIRLYTLLTEMHRDSLRSGHLAERSAIEKGQSRASGIGAANNSTGLSSPRDKLSSAIGSLALEEKEALLLVVLEGFSYSRAARILSISRPVLVARLARARAAVGASLHAEQLPRQSRTRPPHLRLVK
jgi:RNA polymerase sigma-70 factor (ECF subfamily)